MEKKLNTSVLKVTRHIARVKINVSYCLFVILYFKVLKVFEIKIKDKFKKGCHAEPVEAWWAGLCVQPFDELRVTCPVLNILIFNLN